MSGATKRGEKAEQQNAQPTGATRITVRAPQADIASML